MRTISVTLAVALGGLLHGSPAIAQDTALVRVLRPHSAQWQQLLAAEDARAATPAQLDALLAGTRAQEPELRRLAVRALGRLERAELVEQITPLLRDPDAHVRAAAAHALGQAVARGDGSPARERIVPILSGEKDPGVVAAMAETLGRTRHAGIGDAGSTIATLRPLLDHPDATVRLGTVRGLYFLARQPSARPALDSHTREQLLRLATAPGSGPALLHNRLRTVAAGTWVLATRPTATGLSDILNDTSALVRREAASGVLALEDDAAAHELLDRALHDASATVRYDAVRVFGRRFAAHDCAPLLHASHDRNPHVALLAIDLLGRSCTDSTAAIARLDSIARTLPAQEDGAWHYAAHALTSLAAAHANTRAAALLPRFATHRNFFVRTWAADAAGILNNQTLLRQLAFDAHPNVRTVAVQGLARNVGHAADSVYLAQLDQTDNQLLMTAATALDSSRTPNVAPRLLNTLDRISALRRETMRDSRVALLQSIRTVGNPSLGARVQPYLRDFDPTVANLAADILGKWTGTRPAPQPTAPPAVALPTFDEVADLAHSTVRIEMADGAVIELRLLPFAAPTNAARFARLARAGHFNGLTFHRIAPNFVVQGGSPNANEYAGDGPFTRDELEVDNWRGTVGLSTRGRDTGDGQIFINLIDNVRLDHDYTVFAEVVRGLDVVDRLLEGARIRRVVINK